MYLEIKEETEREDKINEENIMTGQQGEKNRERKDVAVLLGEFVLAT